jgi:hypothetical protein
LEFSAFRRGKVLPQKQKSAQNSGFNPPLIGSVIATAGGTKPQRLDRYGFKPPWQPAKTGDFPEDDHSAQDPPLSSENFNIHKHIHIKFCISCQKPSVAANS